MPVVSVVESQIVTPAGNLSDVYEISYTIPGKDGTFTIDVPKNADALAAAEQAIAELTAQVTAIYQIP